MTALLFPRILAVGTPTGKALWQSVCYSAMALTNSGFSSNVGGLAPFADDYGFLSSLMVGAFLGSLGFPVTYALARGWRSPRRWSLPVKLTLFTTTVLLLAGIVMYIALEFDNPETFGSLNAGDTIFQSLFMSVMTRSGGFAAITVSSVLWGSTTVALSCILILQISEAPLDLALFDVISAFATCGLSTGRIGTAPLAAALAASQSRQLFSSPEG